MFVVTEYGLVNLKGKSIPERAKAMISLAHPDSVRTSCGKPGPTA
jgi:acyl-CoA hydrolase